MPVKELDTFGVSQHVRKNKIAQYWSSKLQENNERKNTLVAHCVCFPMHINADLYYFIIWVRNNLFLKNLVLSEGAVYYNVLSYQQLSIALIPSKLLCLQLYRV